MKRHTIENPEGYPKGSYENLWNEVTIQGRTYLLTAVESVLDECKHTTPERACEIVLSHLEEAPYILYDNEHWLEQMEKDIKTFAGTLRRGETRMKNPFKATLGELKELVRDAIYARYNVGDFEELIDFYCVHEPMYEVDDLKKWLEVNIQWIEDGAKKWGEARDKIAGEVATKIKEETGTNADV